MVALGLLLLAMAGLVAAVGALANSGSDHLVYDFSMFGWDITASTGRLFLFGALVGAIGMFGLNMMLAGLGRGLKNKVRHHREARAERAQSSAATSPTAGPGTATSASTEETGQTETIDARDTTVDTTQAAGGRHLRQ